MKTIAEFKYITYLRTLKKAVVVTLLPSYYFPLIQTTRADTCYLRYDGQLGAKIPQPYISNVDIIYGDGARGSFQDPE